MRKALIGMFLVGAAFAPLAVSPALAQSTKDRVEVLEQQVSELKAQAPAATASAVKIGQLEEQIQFLTGRVEELSYKLEQSNARLDAITAALAGDSVGAAGLSASAGGAAVTLGAQGVVLVSDGRMRRVAAFPVQAVDTTGAGDVFHGALTLALARGLPPAQACSFASAAAALKCTRPDGIRGAPTAAQLHAFLQQRC